MTTAAASRRLPGWARPVGTAAFVLGVAAVTGALTPYGELHLPRSIHAAADSSGPWAIVAFVSIYLARARGLFAPVLGACSFVVMDLFFYIAFVLRIGYYSHRYLLFWVLIAVVVGPLVGLCASWLRSPRSILRAIAVAAPSSILIGEGVFMLVWLPNDSHLYATVSVLVGLVLLLGLAVTMVRRLGAILLSCVMCAAASALFFEVYSQVPLVLGTVVP